jgi:hypothetical protein
MGSQDESSLAARRARLRGSLAKQALPPDPYSQDPYARAKTPEPDKAEGNAAITSNAAIASAPTIPSQVAPSRTNEPKAASNGSNGGNAAIAGHAGSGQAAAPARPNFRLEDLAATQQLKPSVAPPGSDFAAMAQSPIAAPTPVQAPTQSPSSLSSHMPTSGGAPNAASFGLGTLSESLKNLSRNPNGASSSGSSALTDIADWSTAEPEPSPAPTPEPEPEQQYEEPAPIANEPMEPTPEPAYEEEFISLESVTAHAGNTGADFFEQSAESSPALSHEAEDSVELTESEIASAPWAHMATNDQDFFDNKSAAQPEKEFEPIAAREEAVEEIPAEPPAMPVVNKETKNKKASSKALKNQPVEEAPAEDGIQTSVPAAQAVVTESKAANLPAPSAVSEEKGVTSINLASIGQMHVIVDEVTSPARVVVDQPAHVIIDKIEHVQVLETLSNMDQAMGACAMNLSALQATANQQTEALRSLSEILQNQTFSELGMSLSGLMESLSAALEPMKAVSELVPAIDQLVQVMETKIKGEPDPVEKLSPDQLVMNLADQLSTGAIDPWTFKSAYMAIFPDDHPADLLHRLVDLLGTSRLSGNLFRAAYDAVQAPDPPKKVFAEDGNTVVKVVQDDGLMQQLEELRRNQSEFEKKMGAREEEFAEMLSSKDQELQDAQELLNSRFEEFNQRYDELGESLQKRDALIQEKETEISRKDNENGRLRTQMDELKDMVGELQKQFSASKARAEALSKPGFFDSAPAAGPAPSLFDAAPARPLFQGEQQQQQQVPQQQVPQQQVHQQQAPQPQPQPQPVAQAPVAMPPQEQQMAGMGAPQQPAMSAPQPNSSMGGAPPNMAPQAAPSHQAIPRQNQMTTPFTNTGPGSYGSGVRAQVFEVIVRQALAGAPWREICAGPMQVNNISPDEVESEVKRRQTLLKK